jgi:ribonuclease P/MRP protein subunit POP5
MLFSLLIKAELGELRVKMKLKPILPSLREKKRYLAFKIMSEDKIGDFQPVLNALNTSIYSFMGELGAAKAGILPMADKYDNVNQTGIIRVSHKYVDELKSALMLIKEINGNQVIVKTAGVSGILKKAGKYIGG